VDRAGREAREDHLEEKALVALGLKDREVQEVPAEWAWDLEVSPRGLHRPFPDSKALALTN